MLLSIFATIMRESRGSRPIDLSLRNQKQVKRKASLQTFIASNSNQSQALLETALERAGEEDSGDEEEMAKEEGQNAFSVRIIGALNARKSALTKPHCLQNFVQSTFNALPSDQVKGYSQSSDSDYLTTSLNLATQLNVCLDFKGSPYLWVVVRF
ncbi:uncharacterized protein LOC126593259 [Malus sylvestris]|uniref:uncharacterized protein LOC126593259 n=1 Tax=Malus sylvestris TaxID=3752 RepID=UPI0021AD20F7|nr:uncharacterized protein LOC126593259 [Malus sylvestris]